MKIIIIDYSQICIANYMQAVGKHTNIGVDIDMFRHMVLNSIRNLNVKFKHEYGEIVIAVDDNNSWRKDIFPYYKANRKEFRQSTDIDWKALFEAMATVIKEIDSVFPYKVIKVSKAEADDIIAALARRCVEEQENCLVVSGDKDFIQLQIDNIFVKQYNPRTDSFITHPEPKRYLFEHVIKGDQSDGVPNAYSLDDHYVVKTTRAKPVTKRKLDDIWDNPCQFDKLLGEFPFIRRNIKLIDLKSTPREIKESVLSSYTKQVVKDKSKVLNYFIANNLKVLSRSLGDF